MVALLGKQLPCSKVHYSLIFSRMKVTVLEVLHLVSNIIDVFLFG